MSVGDEASINLVIDSAMKVVDRYILQKPESVIGIEGADGGWTVTVEALIRKAVPDSQDLLGRYEIRLSSKRNVLGWKLTTVRRRSDCYAQEI